MQPIQLLFPALSASAPVAKGAKAPARAVEQDFATLVFGSDTKPDGDAATTGAWARSVSNSDRPGQATDVEPEVTAGDARSDAVHDTRGDMQEPLYRAQPQDRRSVQDAAPVPEGVLSSLEAGPSSQSPIRLETGSLVPTAPESGDTIPETPVTKISGAIADMRARSEATDKIAEPAVGANPASPALPLQNDAQTPDLTKDYEARDGADLRASARGTDEANASRIQVPLPGPKGREWRTNGAEAWEQSPPQHDAVLPIPTADHSVLQIDVGYRAAAPHAEQSQVCLLYTSPSPRDRTRSRMPSSA